MYKIIIDLTGHEPLRKIGSVFDYIDYKLGKIFRWIGVIASYNGETITTAWISTTGELSTGATVYYVLASVNEASITLPRIEAKEGTSIIDVQTTEDYFILTESGDELVTENGDNLAILPSVTVAASTINAELWNSKY